MYRVPAPRAPRVALFVVNIERSARNANSISLPSLPPLPPCPYPSSHSLSPSLIISASFYLHPISGFLFPAPRRSSHFQFPPRFPFPALGQLRLTSIIADTLTVLCRFIGCRRIVRLTVAAVLDFATSFKLRTS